MSAWSSLPLTIAIEVPVFAARRVAVCAQHHAGRCRRALGVRGLVAFLVAMHAGNLFGPPPPSVAAIAWVGQAQWLLVLWGFWVTNHRRAPTDSGGRPGR